ncbi:MAG: hypothetical protein PUJ68_00125 [[Actinobacillus] rossii]|nr:hypothetical protein [[Actinobacillus] rossii]MDY5792862.1 hypothetical protein [[Actinobacillus] rossii]
MSKFVVLNTAILHNGKRYEIGSEIELTAEQAQNNALNLKAVETAVKSDLMPNSENAVTEADVAAAEANIVEAEEASKKAKKAKD